MQTKDTLCENLKYSYTMSYVNSTVPKT